MTETGPYRPPSQTPEQTVIQYLSTWGGDWMAIPKGESQPSCRIFFDSKHRRSIEFNLDWLDADSGMFNWRRMLDERIKKWY